MGVSLPKTPLFIAAQSWWIGADLNDFMLTWAAKKVFPYQVTFTGTGVGLRTFSWEFGGNIIQPMTVSLPLPAMPHLLAGPRHLAPSQGTLIALTGCLGERTPSHLAAGLGVGAFGARITCPVNARTRLFFLREDKKNACLFLDAEPERGLLSGRFQCPLWHGQKNSTNSPRPQKAKLPSGSARRPPPLCVPVEPPRF